MIYINKINCYKYKFIKEIKKINKKIYIVLLYIKDTRKNYIQQNKVKNTFILYKI